MQSLLVLSLQARSLHLVALPPPSLQELCLHKACDALHKGGWHLAALGGPPSQEWPQSVRLTCAFELHKQERLTPLMRGALALGPPPPPIVVDRVEKSARRPARGHRHTCTCSM